MNTDEIVKHLQEVQEEYCELRANSRRYSPVDNIQLSLGHLYELTTKRRLLRAIKKIYREYYRNHHSLDIDTCPLCIIYRNEAGWIRSCNDCPLTVFKGPQGCKCMNRKCRPVNCFERENRPLVPVVTEFYRRFVAAVEGMTDAEVQAPNAWKFLKTIDNRVYKKYRVIE